MVFVILFRKSRRLIVPRINSISSINFSELSKALPPPLKNLNWKVTAYFALAITAVVALIIRQMMHNPKPDAKADPKSPETKKQEAKPDTQADPKPPETKKQETTTDTKADPKSPQETPPNTQANPQPASVRWPAIMKATCDDLGFSIETLNQIEKVPAPWGGMQQWTFSEVCDWTLKAIQKESTVQKTSKVTINKLDSGHILDYLNFGLPKDKSYQDASERSKSWIDMILTKLSEKNYITGFQIGESQLGSREIIIELAR
jgi:hypothetical protein